MTTTSHRSATTPPLDRIDHVHVFVADRSAATAWYERVLGLAPSPHLAHWAAGGGPLVLADAGGRVHLALFERPPAPCRSTLAFGVSAAAFGAWRVHLADCLGAPPEVEDHGESRSLYFSDPDDNPFEITCDDVAALTAWATERAAGR